MKYKEIIYIVNDLCKQFSDDSTITEDHILFLLKKYRSLILQQYLDANKELTDANYQILCLDLEKIDGVPCIANAKLRSIQEIPAIFKMKGTTVYANDYYIGDINFISKERMRYVGHNKFLKNQLYCSLGPDSHLYLTSCNPQLYYLKSLKLYAIFEDPELAEQLECSHTDCVDILDKDFPLQDSLVVNVIQSTLKDILGAAYRPIDNMNDAKDDLANIATYLRNNVKSKLEKQIDGTAE